MLEKITYLFLVLFSRFLSILPRKLILFSGQAFGLLMYYFFPLRKKVAKINLKIAFPKKTNKEINYLIRKTFKHYGLLMFEFISNHNSKFNNKIFNMDDETENLLNKKDGMICMTAHFGNWEMLIPIISQRKMFTVIVREQKNNGADKFFYECRKFNNNIVLISKKGSKKEMINNLKEGHVLGLATDQNAHNRGTQTFFFNKKASFPKGAGHFYYLTNAKLIVGFCILTKNYNYELKLREIFLNKKYEQKDDLIVEVNNIYAKMLEDQIKKRPEQYFWFHKKWDKTIY